MVRIGDTVRKPWTRSSPAVGRYMTFLRDAGLDVPRFLGRDDRNRQVIEYLPGPMAIDGPPPGTAVLAGIGAMVRAVHDASAAFTPPADARWEVVLPVPADLPGEPVICHNDLAPWNLVLGTRRVFIDWDGAGPSTRLWDLAYSAQAFALNDPDRDPDAAAGDLSAFVAGYRADPSLRAALPAAMARRARAMWQLLAASHETGRQPWAAMYTAGHGAHWDRAACYVEEHRDLWAHVLDDIRAASGQ
ncbi:hypothetical protein JS278_00760 [Acidipropionibacterium virtanenii]|uniref:Aminoglycoside phosphotransferase domain-containing protein n=1 Tax=Acidipropionibacterium virtanenii TaxID=2057246 RepID=A0A344URQ3_9ACTN|nr:hypothetical protein JS278_00760 [Acidipropionibacterium virtanenii]